MNKNRSQNGLTSRAAFLSSLASVILIVGAAGGALLPSTASAQLEEVVVTARARTESLQDVPSTVTAFTENQISDMGVQRAEDFISQTPGVSFVNTVETGDSQVSIRGVNNARDAEASFALLIDGILYPNPWSFNREYSDLAQIEILKGPQGALYGRAASAGAMIISTKRPTQEFEGEVNISAAQDSTFTGMATISGPLADNVAGRLTVDYRESDGYYSNVFLSEDVVDRMENYSVSSRLVFDVSEDLVIDAKMRYAEAEAAAISFNAAFGLPSFVPFGTPGAESFYQDVNTHDFIFSGNVEPINRQDVLELSVKADWTRDWGTISSYVSYADAEDSFVGDGTSGWASYYFQEQGCLNSLAGGSPSYTPDVPGGVFPMAAPQFVFGPAAAAVVLGPYTFSSCDGYQYQERFEEDLSFQIQFTSNDDQRLRWQAGLYFLEIDRYQAQITALDDGANWPNKANNVPEIIYTDRTDAMVNDSFDTTVWAIFGSVNYDITEDVELSLALRYDEEDRSTTNGVPSPADGALSTRIDFCEGRCTLNGQTLPGSPLNPGFVNLDTFEVSPTMPGQSETFDELQPKLSLTWDASDTTTLYGSWGVGFKAGSFNNGGTTSIIQYYFVARAGDLAAPPELIREETSSAFELGFRSSMLDGRLELTGAAFYTEVDDMQFFEFFVGNFGLLRTASNIDEVTIQGFELGAAWALTDNLRLDLGYSSIDGEIDENSLRPYTVGNDVPNNPEFTFNAAIQYVKPIGSIELFGRLDYSYQGDTWYHTVQDDVVKAVVFEAFGDPYANYDRTQVEGYGLANLRAGIRTEQYSVTAFAKNLTDEEYIAEVILAAEFGGAFVTPGTQRRVGVEFQWYF